MSSKEDVLIQSGSLGAEPDDSDGVFFVSLQYMGVAYDVPVQTGDSVSSIFDFVQEALDFPRDNCKLICRGKVLRPHDAVSSSGKDRLLPGSKLMLVATSARDIAVVQSSRPDPLVKGFVEEERDEKRRQKRARQAALSAWGTKQDAEYRFGSIKAEFKYNTPPPYEAERLLQKLATDPGIVEIMQTRHFKVGVLTEMSPAEAQDRMARKGTPNLDLLGYNQNSGGMIVLKLRTDNVKGFRPYHDLINTLLHELTHNVWGPHDQNFWKLFGELKAQYMRFHRFWSQGGRAAESSEFGQFQGFAGDEDEGATQESGSAGFGRVLGGGSSGDAATAAEQRAAAADSRIAAAGIGFDFLNSGGTPVFVCPCGLIHGALECPKGFEGDADTISDKDKGISIAAATASNDVDTVSVVVTSKSSTTSPAITDLGAKAAAKAAELPLDEVKSAIKPQTGSATTSNNDSGPLVRTQGLAESGLDGAAVWLERFTDKLDMLRGSSGDAKAQVAVELVLRLIKNIVNSPNNERYRRVRADNPKIRAGLLSAGPVAEEMMALLGFEAKTEAGELIFLLHETAFDCARLRLGKDLLEQQLEAIMVAAH